MLIVVCIGDVSSSTLNDKTASGIIVSFEVCRNLIWQKKKKGKIKVCLTLMTLFISMVRR